MIVQLNVKISIKKTRISIADGGESRLVVSSDKSFPDSCCALDFFGSKSCIILHVEETREGISNTINPNPSINELREEKEKKREKCVYFNIK